MNLDRLHKYYEDGWLIKQTHPELPLTIWNYSQSTQFERKWDEITLQCRGLVTDEDGNVVARPFRKFFNIEEGKHTPTKDFSVYEKMDGSLIILFNYNGEWIVGSRGSFTSDQAVAARNIINQTDLDNVGLPNEYTFLFEFTAPWNRIVVDYGEGEELTLLGIVNTNSGEEIPVDLFAKYLNRYCKIGNPYNEVKEYDNIEDYESLKEIIDDNQEGFVIHFSNGDRCKIKGEEYVRLHGIMTNVSTKSIWECLSNGDPLDEYIKEVPDEFYDKVKLYVAELESQYWEVADKAGSLFKSIYKEGMEPKEFASEIKYLDKAYQGMMWSQFHMDFSKYSDTIWNYIKPDFEKL